MTVVAKPTVFVSSTIYDFQDLRSGLKFWLEELGFDVMLSEFNDFPKTPDQNSYDACLAAIAKADFFVLLIGNRAGGWFDEAKKISITRMEYRAAYERFTANGTPKPIVFVRQNLWDVREDRVALDRYLKEVDDKQLSASEKKAIANHPTKFADNAEAIFSFLKEVGQVEAMKNAVAGAGALPQGNWIHRFNTFRDITDALRIALNATSHVERRLLQANLVQELSANLAHLLTKHEDGSLAPVSLAGMFAVSAMRGGPSDSSEMKGDYALWLGMFKIISMGIPRRLSMLFTREAVRSGAFMQHAAATGTFEPTPLHQALFELLTLTDSLQAAPAPDTAQLLAFIEKTKKCGCQPSVSVPNIDIALASGEAKMFDRVTELTRRCLKHLSGDETALNMLKRWSPSPFPEEIAKIASHTVGPQEAAAWAVGQR